MNLEPGWKKALIVLAVISCILIVYAYGSLKLNSNNSSNQSMGQPIVDQGIQPQSASPNNSSISNNGTNGTVNTNNNSSQPLNETNKVSFEQKSTGSSLVKI